MNKLNHKLDPNLTSEEKQILWSTVKTRISGETVTSLDKIRYKQWIYQFNYKGVFMGIIPWIIAGVMAFGGSTAVLADSANPGDPLFTVDQKMEQFQERFMLWNDNIKLRFHARISNERLVELKELQKVSPEELPIKAKELWEKHQVEAVERLERHVEKVHELQVHFEERLDEAESEVVKERIQRKIDRVNIIEEKRTENLSKLSEKEFPGVEMIQVKLDKLQEWQNLNDVKKVELREEMKVKIRTNLNKAKALIKDRIDLQNI